MNINEILNIKYPIIQGGMAHISRASLAAAVSNAGGLGQIASGGFKAGEVREEIRKVRKLTDKPFGVNVVLMNEDVEDLVKVIIEERVEIITCGAGNPAPFFEKWLDAGIKVIPVIANVKMAKKVEQLGATALVFEGAEAGGHIGSLNTFAELPAIKDSVNIPVIGAGGVYTGKQMLAAEILGASGVQIGTKLLTAEETPVHENFKRALIEAKDSDIMVTGIRTKMPTRVLKNDLAKKLNEIEMSAGDLDEFFKLTKGSGKKAVEGDANWGSIYTGEGLYFLNKIESVREILDDLMKEYEEAKKYFKENL